MSEPVRVIKSPVRLEYTVNAGLATSRFLRGMAQGRVFGQACPLCHKVYVPPRGSCPTCAVPTEGEVAVSDTGTVTTFCIVNIPFENQAIEPPFAYAWILLDGADTPMFHLIQEIPVAEVRMGLRVKAVWVPAAELRPSVESIRHFRPTGQPDAPFESYAGYL
jgi:uncharacterized OB-fold protein